MRKVLVTEKIAPEGIEILESKGYQVDVRLKMTPEELIKTIPGYEAIIIRSRTKIDAEVLEAASDLRIIGRAGVTLDNVDIAAATERGIIVCNAPTSNVVTAAEHAMALILACARKIPQANQCMHEHKWERTVFMGTELYKKTLAIFGLGRIGSLVADRARSFGMNIIAYDPYISEERAGQVGAKLYTDLNEVLAEADIISVHLPKTDETIGMFGPDQFAAMKDGVIIVNTARSSLFNYDSMADFLAAGKIGAVGVDVFPNEPCLDSPLHEFDNAILTPHIAAVTTEAMSRASRQIGEYIAMGMDGSIVPTSVNVTTIAPEIIDSVRPYIPVCETMGKIIAQLLGRVPKRLSVTTAGAIADADPDGLVAGAVKGLLSYKRLATVTPSTARQVADRHGIRIDTFPSADAAGYQSAVVLRADGLEIACTMTDMNQRPRVVSLLDYKVDLSFDNQALVFEYVDGPGRIGVIGTILGEAGVNITTMHIGHKSDANTSLVYLNIEGEVTSDLIDRLTEEIKPQNLWHIEL